MNLAGKTAAYAPAYESEYKRLKAAGVKFLQSHMVDMAGQFRSKISPLKLSASGDALNGILYCVSHGDGQPIGDTAFAAPLASDSNGYPNIQAVADPASLRQHGWRPRMKHKVAGSSAGQGISPDAYGHSRFMEHARRYRFPALRSYSLRSEPSVIDRITQSIVSISPKVEDAVDEGNVQRLHQLLVALRRREDGEGYC